jgi:hypothetical protein
VVGVHRPAEGVPKAKRSVCAGGNDGAGGAGGFKREGSDDVVGMSGEIVLRGGGEKRAAIFSNT